MNTVGSMGARLALAATVVDTAADVAMAVRTETGSALAVCSPTET
jgi:hypothetical protein